MPKSITGLSARFAHCTDGQHNPASIALKYQKYCISRLVRPTYAQLLSSLNTRLNPEDANMAWIQEVCFSVVCDSCGCDLETQDPVFRYL